MLVTSRGGTIDSVPQIPVRGGVIEVEALSVDDAARIAGFCRSFLYPALNPDPAKRNGLPFLPSMKVGRARRIRLATLRQWLADLEQAQQPPAA